MQTGIEMIATRREDDMVSIYHRFAREIIKSNKPVRMEFVESY